MEERGPLHRLRDRVRERLRPLWRAYVRVPRPIRWPVTGMLLLFGAVILTNLTFGATRTVERTFLIPAGELRIVEVQVEAGQNSEVRWEIGAREGESSAFPLRATLLGPDERQVSLGGPGAFRFKGGFTTARYVLELRNEAEEANAPVQVHWTVR
ncbi:MAG: hypothetical protein DK306_001934 [Chloroflexi bacterium]|nr:MAG: hypothetical protein DK306_001934 [Chloroflexota bacterium]